VLCGLRAKGAQALLAQSKAYFVNRAPFTKTVKDAPPENSNPRRRLCHLHLGLLDWQFVDADAELGNRQPAGHSRQRTLHNVHHQRLAGLIVGGQV